MLQVTQIIGYDRRKIRVLFNQDVVLGDGTTASDALNPANYSVVPTDLPEFTAAYTPTVTGAVAIETSLVEISMDDDLSYGLDYRAEVRNVEALGGDPLDLGANGQTFTAMTPQGPATRSFNLIDMLPRIIVSQDSTGDLRRFISILQDVTGVLLSDADRFTEILDLERASEDFLDLILADLGNPFQFDLTEQNKRSLARLLVPIYQQKGTVPGVQNLVRFFLGIELVDVVEHLADCMELGVSELGFDWVLCPGDSYQRYSFDVVVGKTLSDSERTIIRGLINYVKPAHTHFVRLIEPTSPSFIDHWELGYSLLGDETVLHQ